MSEQRLQHNLTSEQLILIGEIAVHWSFVDNILGDLVGGFKGLSQGDRSKFIRPKDTHLKVTEAQTLAKTQVQDQKDLIKLQACLRDTKELAAERNLFLHGIPIFKDAAGRTPPEFFIFRGKYGNSLQSVSIVRLGSTLDDIIQLGRKLQGFCEKYNFIVRASLDKQEPQGH